MTRLKMIASTILLLCGTAAAQSDSFGILDTLYAELEPISAQSWKVTVSYSNDQNIVGLVVPLRITAGMNRIVADSASYVGGRVEDWDYLAFRADTAIQAVTLGMIANIGPTTHRLTAGSGRLVTVFISSLDGNPIPELDIDTTTTHPNNSLEVIADSVQPGMDDTTRVTSMQERKIYPAWVIRRAQ